MGASVVAGVSILGAPAFAGTLTGVSTTGDVRVFEQINATQLQLAGSNSNTTALAALLSQGNVELDDNIDSGWANATPSTLTANFNDGRSIMFGSVGKGDWDGGLAAAWTNKAYTTYANIFNQFNLTSGSAVLGAINTTFASKNIFQRLSDPNIAYVTGDSGEFTFGLAGHNTLASGLKMTAPVRSSYSSGFTDTLAYNAALAQYNAFNSMVASEVVKYSLDGGVNWNFAYSFGENSYASGVVDKGDGFSHTRNFEFTVGTREVADVPEPSTLLGLAAIGGLVVAAKRRKNA
jgi:hypothetical protein